MRFSPTVNIARPFKSTPFIVAFFFFLMIAGTFLNSAFAPLARAKDQLFRRAVVAATAPCSAIPSDVPSSGDCELDEIIFRSGARHGVDPRLLHHVIWQESKYKLAAESHKGAQGLMQLIPSTARRFNCTNARDPQQNIEAGTRYLRKLLERFDGNIALALAGYNAGEGNVDKYDGVPPFNETQNYVRIITGRYGKTFHPVLTADQARAEFKLDRELVARLGR
ncbi:MAG: lytic transglycosylase domain-containing protein [Pyrinomonadaceae bacterium]|nr:lytic transglycosylase domain-containing protein [Pyrinomonadaceae bacterium]